MKKSIFVGLSITMALLTAPSFNADAAAKYTYCGYELVAGAPWAERYKSSTHSGHIQCAANKSSAIGYYRLVSQRHYN